MTNTKGTGGVTRVPVKKFFDTKTKTKTNTHVTNNTSVFTEQPKAINTLTDASKTTIKTITQPQKPFQKLWIGAAITAGVSLFILLFKHAKKEYKHKFVVTPADESNITPEDQAYMDSLNNNHNELVKKIGGKPMENTKAKTTQTEYVRPQLTADERKKVADNAKVLEPYLKYETMTAKEMIDSSYARIRRPEYVSIKESKQDNKKAENIQKKVTENPMVVKNKETVKTEEKVQKTSVNETVVPKTKTNSNLKPEIKEESKFIKKYVTNFIKLDLISKPAAYTETANSFIKEFGYKPNNDEIADYVIAKKGDYVIGIMEKEAVKKLGRALNKKEKAIITNLANKVTIGRRTSIDNPKNNNRMMPGDTIPTREIKMLFN